MSTIAFFPWLQLAGSLDVGPWTLFTYQRGNLPFGTGTEKQKMCDLLLHPYREVSGSPLVHCTVVLKQESDWDIDDAEVTALLEMAENLAFSGLAARRYFHWSYWNREHFRLVIQSYTDPASGIAIQVPRRDGSTLSFVSNNAYHVRRPFHVPSCLDVEVDRALLDALMQARSQGVAAVWEAVLSFNVASTDNPEVSWEVEVIHLVSALQRLLDSSSACADVVRRAAAVLPPTLHECWPCKRIVRSERLRSSIMKAQDIRSAWLTELCALRGHVAHGRPASAFPGCWSAREHLLLGSYILPRVAKYVMAEQSLYSPTPEDEWEVEAFSRFACEYHFEENRSTGGHKHPWEAIWRTPSMREASRRFAEALAAMTTSDGKHGGDRSNA